MDDGAKDEGVHIDLKISIYGATYKNSRLVAETAADAATAMEKMGISGADIAIGLISAALALIEENADHATIH